VSEPSKEEALFGKIALHNKLISQGQLEDAMSIRRKRTDDTQDLGRIMRSEGLLDEKQYKSVRKAQEKHLMSKGMGKEEARLAARGIAADSAGGAALMGDDANAADEADGSTIAAPPGTARFDNKTVKDAKDELSPDMFVNQDEAPPQRPASRAEEEAPPPREERPPTESSEDLTEERKAALASTFAKRPIDESAKKTIISLLKKARESGASDLHLSCGSKPFFRLYGEIKYLNMPVCTDQQNQLYFAQLMTDAQWNHFVEKNDFDGSVDLGGATGRFRANVLRQRRGVSGVFRVIKSKVPTLQELGLPEALERFTTYHQGLVLVTGSAGSGKSSTLAALIELINQTWKDHIITLEDPIEYVYECKGCNVTQRQIDLHTKSWSNALRASLREDPDVIMIGEMRDLETVSLAITAAETGHLVFGTLHTTNATRTIDRVLDVFPPKEQSQIRAMVSESLKGVISQQLVPKADGSGRVAAVEILITTPAVANLIREKRTFQLFSIMQTGRKLGMQLMDDSLMDLLKQNMITKEEAKRRATNPKLFGG
jgi:twitching motility protein PilT